MNNICPNPGCGAVYNITPQHVGRRLICKKCAAPLLVTDYGLQVEAGAPAGVPPAEGAPFPPHAPELPAAPPPAPRRGPSGPNPFTRFLDWVKGVEVATWLFGVGAFLVIMYVFFPIIDQAVVNRRSALIKAGENRQARLLTEYKLKDDQLREQYELKDKEAKEPPSAEEMKRRQKEREDEQKRRQKESVEWEKEKLALKSDVDDADIGARRASYWYFYGMMLGFLLLSFGALGYVHPSQPLPRRILGAVVLVALLLSIFQAFAGLGIRFEIGGRPSISKDLP
jgi:hypothetical protein